MVVSFSSTYMAQERLIARTIEALGGVSVRALVTTGPAVDPGSLLTPSNVVAVRDANGHVTTYTYNRDNERTLRHNAIHDEKSGSVNEIFQMEEELPCRSHLCKGWGDSPSVQSVRGAFSDSAIP